MNIPPELIKQIIIGIALFLLGIAGYKVLTPTVTFPYTTIFYSNFPYTTIFYSNFPYTTIFYTTIKRNQDIGSQSQQ
jgi:hypothetical protein